MHLIQPLNFGHAEVASGHASVRRKAVMADFHPGMWVLRCVERAQIDTMPQKAALDDMKIDRSQWHAQILGLGHLSVLRLGMLGESFWKALFHHISDHYGWNLAILQSVKHPETPEQEFKRAVAMAAQAFLVIRKYGEVGASMLDCEGTNK